MCSFLCPKKWLSVPRGVSKLWLKGAAHAFTWYLGVIWDHQHSGSEFAGCCWELLCLFRSVSCVINVESFLVQSDDTVLKRCWDLSVKKSSVSFRQSTDHCPGCCLQARSSSTLSIVDYVCNLCAKKWQGEGQKTVLRRNSYWLLVQDLQFGIFFCLSPSNATLAFYVIWK